MVAENLNRLLCFMAEITMAVTSIDSLAPYKVSADLMLELINVTATVEDDPEGASVGTWWVQIIEPPELVKHQPPGGYILDNRQVHMTCAKSAGVSLGDRIKFTIVS
ncbi:MAG: hypothetical protein JO313_04755 [Verrucomicrobia bacterium]|nr:hypothetical protein [Verrucomicrobiota bacterium]